MIVSVRAPYLQSEKGLRLCNVWWVAFGAYELKCVVPGLGPTNLSGSWPTTVKACTVHPGTGHQRTAARIGTTRL